MRPILLCFSLAFGVANVPLTRAAATATNTPAPPPRASHVSNSDETKVGTDTLPDPLVLQNGQPVHDANMWFKLRRPEILKLYETEIYGRVPDHAPKVKFEVTATETNASDGLAIRKDIVGSIGDAPGGLTVRLVLYLPAKTTGPVPVLLHVLFGNLPASASSKASTNSTRPGEIGPISEILARGYGYAVFRYTEIEGDLRTNNLTLVRKLSLAPHQTQPAPDEWGTITAWAWGASRVLDHLETDRAVDAKRVALMGHSRLGKTTLWAGARDARFALVFASCSGEMGASLARRNAGETVDNVIANFPWWLAGNFQKYAGRWNDLPVDSHLLIALNAPRPVFITGGTQDQWADPEGMFLAEVAAGPVYRLLGKKDLGTTDLPIDTPLITGDLGFHYHTGGHNITAEDWKAFLDFADRHLK